MISYIVSLYDRISPLKACLACLALQRGLLEIMVCGNSQDEEILRRQSEVCKQFAARMIWTGPVGAIGCYESANMVAPDASGNWLCFPSDDSVYVARFAEIMLDTAQKTGADLVYCDCVYAVGSEKNNWPPYTVLETQPKMGRIDKSCFILRRELFKGFPHHPQVYCDGALIEQLVRDGVKHAKAPGVLVVHQ